MSVPRMAGRTMRSSSSTSSVEDDETTSAEVPICCVFATAEPLPEANLFTDVEAAATPATAVTVADGEIVYSSEGIFGHTASILAVTAHAVLEAAGSIGAAPPPAATSLASTIQAQYLSATLIKSKPATKLGLGLRQHQDGFLRVSFIREASVLASSPIRVGDRILSINGKNCFDMDKASAVRLLSSLCGFVTLIAQRLEGNPNYVATMVEKPSSDHPVGLGLRRNAQGSLEVSTITLNGLFAHSILNVDDRVLAINNVECPRLEPQAAIDLIKGSKHVTLLTATKGVVHAATRGNGPDSGVLAATATADLVGVSNAFGLPKHLCFCTWLIILSMVILSAVILVLGNRD